METPTKEEQKKDWRWLWLSAIEAFANTTVQQKRWTDPNERNPHFSFVECMCGYFDDAFMNEQQAYERRIASGWLSPGEAAVMIQFHTAAAEYKPPEADYYAVDAILADPAWQNVVALAQAAQQRLLPLLTDQEERTALTVPLEWREENGIYSAGRTGSPHVR